MTEVLQVCKHCQTRCAHLLLGPELQLLAKTVKLFLCANSFQLLRTQKHAPWHTAILLTVMQLMCHSAALQIWHFCNGPNLQVK